MGVLVKHMLGVVGTICIVLATVGAYAQDPQFTQFYASGLYHNPSLTGDNIGNRIMANYRNQWPAIPKGYVTYGTYYDKNLKTINSGIGIGVIQDKAGLDGYKGTSSSLFYSYNFKVSKLYRVRVGAKVSANQLNLNDQSLIFASDLVDDSSFDRPQIQSNVMYPNIGAGILVHNKEQLWFGLGVYHLNRPMYAFSGDRDIRQPIKYSVQAGYNTRRRFGHGAMRSHYFTFMAHYKAQEKWDQVDVGAYWQKKNQALIFGIWYRGIPGLKSYKPEYINHDAVNLLAGMKFGTFYFGYSYDITISRLRTDSGGSHEISIAIEWVNTAKFKPFRRETLTKIPCAKF